MEPNSRIQIQRVHSTRTDDFFQSSREAELERLGVKVNGFYQGGTRAIPLPIFDETQWDHYLYHKGKENAMNQQERLASDVGMHVLKKAGVAGKRPSNSPVYGCCIDLFPYETHFD
jgi:hypothetical protein